MKSVESVCFQINLCPGDVRYAEQTVPALVHAHPEVSHRLAIVDCHKPQLTRANPDSTRYAEPEFSNRVRQIKSLADQFSRQGLFDEVLILEGGEDLPLRRRWSRHFTQSLIPHHRTHDYHGAALSAYWAMMDYPEHRFVLHYDADILLYQESGFDWVAEALSFWDRNPDVVFATPRTSPPGFSPDAPSLHEGRPFEVCPGGWLNDWFSTRCALIDRERLNPFLPLVRGSLWWQTLFYRIIKRRYPPSPEILLFKSAGSRGARRLNLSSPKAWMLHPTSKPEPFLNRLDDMMTAVSRGTVPDQQIGRTEIQLEAWLQWLDS